MPLDSAVERAFARTVVAAATDAAVTIPAGDESLRETFPDVPVDVLGAKALILRQNRDQLQRYIDLPAFKGDEYQIQKLALILHH